MHIENSYSYDTSELVLHGHQPVGTDAGYESTACPRWVPNGRKTCPVCAEAIEGEPCSMDSTRLLSLDPRRAKAQEFLRKSEWLKIILLETLELGYADTQALVIIIRGSKLIKSF